MPRCAPSILFLPALEVGPRTISLKPLMRRLRTRAQLEYMIAAADHSTSGHLGYNFVVSEGDHKQVARGLAEMLACTHVCLFCLQRAWRDGMSAHEAAEALRCAKAECDSYCEPCAAGEEGCGHAGTHWTQRPCSRAKAAQALTIKLYVLGATIDCGGNQHGLINRSFDGTLETEDEPYHEAGGPRLHGLPILPDAAHLNKSLDSNCYHNKIWLRGCLCGAFQLWSRYWDADPVRRTAVRTELTRELLRRKNAFSVEAAVKRRERPLLRALLSDAESAAGRAWLVSTLGPARCRPWRENTPSMYGQPMGVAFHAASNLIFYVDRELKQGRALKLSHTPCDNAAFTAASRSATVISQLRRPVDIALVDTDAYITDEDHEHPALYTLNVAHVCKSFATAEEGGGGRSAVTRVRLRGAVALRHPFGIAADASTRELFVGCRQACTILRITLSSAGAGVVELLCRLPAPPAGIDVSLATSVTPSRLVVATASTVFLVSRTSGEMLRIFERKGADLCGVRIAPAALGSTLFVIDRRGNAVLSLAASNEGEAPFRPSLEAQILVGGNAMRPCSERSAFWYEGTASEVELWQPTFGVFARNAFVFMNSGRGEYGKVLLLNDLYPMAASLAPTMLLAADGFRLSVNAEHHAIDRLHAALVMEPLTDLLLEIEDGNGEVRHARGLQGEMGNFSNVVRKSCHQLPQLLLAQVSTTASIGAPKRCLDALSVTSITTLDVETFFIGQRSHWPNPYASQYSQSHALAMLLEGARRGDAPFSFCTTSNKASHAGRKHYHSSGGLAIAERRYQLSHQKPISMPIAKRQRRLKVLHALAALFKQARQQRVTDKGKEKSGTQPAPAYGPKAVSTKPADGQLSDLLTASDPRAQQRGSCEGSGEGLGGVRVVYRSGDIVVVKPLRAALWIAQLQEALIQDSHGGFNLDRLRCRYFVLTAELGAYPHALTWWHARGEQLRLEDEAAALVRAAASDAVHFSFEKLDHVTRSTICGSLSTSCLTEALYFRHELISFAISEETMVQAREIVSDMSASEESEAAAEQMESERQAQMAAQREAEQLAAAERAAAAHAQLNAKREEGKERERQHKHRKKSA